MMPSQVDVEDINFPPINNWNIYLLLKAADIMESDEGGYIHSDCDPTAGVCREGCIHHSLLNAQIDIPSDIQGPTPDANNERSQNLNDPTNNGNNSPSFHGSMHPSAVPSPIKQTAFEIVIRQRSYS